MLNMIYDYISNIKEEKGEKKNKLKNNKRNE